MAGLDSWLKQATLRLARESADQVRTEIREHYEAAREAAVAGGASGERADEQALAALGDPRTANRQYRKVLLTTAEARVLREGNWEAKVFCSLRPGKWILPAISVLALLVSGALFFTGSTGVARVLLAGGLGMGFLFTTPFLPVYTLARGRVVRFAKWIVLAGMVAAAFGPDLPRFSWLLFSSFYPMVLVETRRNSIRRKLPMAQWPKHLYL